VRALEDELRVRMRRLLDSVPEDCDFLVDVAAELPMQAICLLLGVPEADRHRLAHSVEHVFDIPDESDFLSMSPQRQAAVDDLYAYGIALIEEKRRCPRDDMLSAVVHAELADVDPPRLTGDELSAFFSLPFSAGAETTRNAIAGALIAFSEWPDELDCVRQAPGAFPHSAVEVILRWTTPSPSKRRTATRTYDLGGHRSRRGQGGRLGGLRQPRCEPRFAEPDVFRFDREPNPHLAFGHGAHFCLGAHLARLETRVAFSEFLERVESFHLTGLPEWTRSNRHSGIRHLPIRLARTPAR
jgi:cytochrome P450